MRWFFKCSICHWRWELWLAKEAKLLSGTTFAKTQGIRNRVRRVLLQTMGLGEMETKVRQLCKHLHLSSLMKLQISKKGWNLIKTNRVLINHQTEFINPSTETGQHNRSLVTEQLMIMQDAKCVIVINAVDYNSGSHTQNSEKSGKTDIGPFGWCWVEPYIEDEENKVLRAKRKKRALQRITKVPASKLWGFCSASCSVHYVMPSTYHEQVLLGHFWYSSCLRQNHNAILLPDPQQHPHRQTAKTLSASD